MGELELWYPGFPLYEDSHVKKLVPNLSIRPTVGHSSELVSGAPNADAGLAELMPAEVAVAEDFKRLLAVLAPDKRKLIGADIGPVMQVTAKESKKKGRFNKGDDSSSKTTENVDRLHAQVQEQEAYIARLKEEIAALEPQQDGADNNESPVSPKDDSEDGG